MAEGRATQEQLPNAALEPPWTTHMDVGSVPKRREREGAGFTARLETSAPDARDGQCKYSFLNTR
jgi:hypothetical protein